MCEGAIISEGETVKDDSVTILALGVNELEQQGELGDWGSGGGRFADVSTLGSNVSLGLSVDNHGEKKFSDNASYR